MVLAHTADGLIEGEEFNNEYGGKYFSFKGVPYAKPPLGDLRFKAPQPMTPWKGIRPTKEFGPVCPQHDVFHRAIRSGSEDCLYLNVYTPEMTPRKPLPVMFWIHGGGFSFGSGNDDIYGPEFLVRKGVILVTFNYRVGVLGFLCLHTEDVPGNAGMKDQVAALKWVKENIKNFGGDPDNVTIFGESAGAASVNYHLISPMSKGLFKRAIMQSGAASCWWAQSFEPKLRAVALAKILGFESDNDKDLYEFLKTVPSDKFIDVAPIILFEEASKVCLNLFFNVVSEKKFKNNERFFYGDVEEALKKGFHEGVSVISGYVSDESLVIFAFMNILDKMIDQANNFYQFFVPKSIALKHPISKQLEVGRKMKEFYFNDEKITMDNVDQLFKYLSTDLVTYNSMKVAKICGENNKNVMYVYKFTCKSERNVFTNIFEIENIVGDKLVTCHSDDLAYLFSVNLRPQTIDKSSNTFSLIERMTTLWTNFAKYGNPTPDSSLGVEWTPYTQNKQHYLIIDQDLKMRECIEKEELAFWDSIHEEFAV